MMQQMQAILAKIKEYDRILIFRHVRNDGDCVGASMGLRDILWASFPQKEVYVIDQERSEFLAFLGECDPEIPDAMYADALGIVVDTGNTKRISNQKFTLCKEIVKIDHHIPVDHYGVINWVEEEASSACELIVKFYDTFRDELQLPKSAARFLYTGMITDSGRFKYECVNGDTMRRAGILLDAGVDTENIFSNLYLEEFEHLKFKAHVYKSMKITENGVAWIYVSRAMQEKFGLNMESASSVVGMLDTIKGSLCWLAFIESGDEEGSIRVRLRSRYMTINTLAEQYRGGGHACAAGATVFNRREVNALVRKADAMVKEYKESHEGWL